MAAPELVNIDRLRLQLVGAIQETGPSADAVWNVRGAPGVGKSHLLKTFAQDLRQKGRLTPIIIAPPPGEIDSGGVALIQIGEGLKKAFPDDVDLSRLTDPKMHWRDKVTEVKSWLEEFSERIVLLCDEPRAWPSGTNDHRHFAGHARDVIGIALHQAQCRRVVAGMLPSGMQALDSRTLPASTGATQAWLRDWAAWDSLADTASGMADSGSALEAFSPLQVRLLVALAHTGSIGAVRRLTSQPLSAMQLAQALLGRLMEEQCFRELVRVWLDLALVRRPFSQGLLNALGASRLDRPSQDLLNKCLLYEDGQDIVMHDVLRVVVRNQTYRRISDTRAAHGTLARYYKERFVSNEHRNGYLAEAMEAYHHASEWGDPSVRDEYTAFFVDQLDALGRSLSLQKKYKNAAETFKCAFTWEPEDDYAHHYYAYNLDIEGQEPDDVERHYREAISLDRTNIWWWSRCISFLITLGRVPEARKLWGEALEEFANRGGSDDLFLYENLHLWIVRLLLHRGRLDFAEEVLDTVPEETRSNSPRLRAVWRYFLALKKARRGQTVFPLDIRPEDWWQGPHRSALRDGNDKKLSRWLPGRVDEVTKDEIILTVAVPPTDERSEPEYGSLSFSAEDFDRASRDERFRALAAGRFVEIAYYAGQKQPVIRVYPDRSWIDEDLPVVWPDPVRYLRRRGRVR